MKRFDHIMAATLRRFVRLRYPENPIGRRAPAGFKWTFDAIYSPYEYAAYTPYFGSNGTRASMTLKERYPKATTGNFPDWNSAMQLFDHRARYTEVRDMLAVDFNIWVVDIYDWFGNEIGFVVVKMVPLSPTELMLSEG